MIITIDGPVASGKSTIAQAIARKYNLYYISSGLLFRAMAYFLMKQYHYTPTTIDYAQEHEINNFLLYHSFVYTYDATGVHILLDDVEITPILKSSELDIASSIIATNTIVRQVILTIQRKLAQDHSIIIEGRDCGSVVFPHADVKFFLTATVEVRAQRWQQLQALHSNVVSLQDAIAFITLRDERDMHRTLDPLVIPAGAHIIDNSTMSKSETINAMLTIIKNNN